MQNNNLITGGLGFSLGSSIIEKLPDSIAKEGIQKGLGTAGSFFPVMANIKMSGYVTKKLKKLK